MSHAEPPMDQILPEIPDHELIRQIGKGGFGEVWLARTRATGRARAVKIVFRDRFAEDSPYELEFSGLRIFEEVSREHEGFVDILHISRDDVLGHFAYVMELADDRQGLRVGETADYAPKTLEDEIEQLGRLPVSQCIEVTTAMCSALGALHQRGLVHRDVKPSNIIFVRGTPKLADIGLVTASDGDHPMVVGTMGYLDAEIHGTPAGDLFGLARVLYVMATGRKPSDYPAPTAFPVPPAEAEVYAGLERFWQRAMDPDRSVRPGSSAEFQTALKSITRTVATRRLERLERWYGNLKRYGVLTGIAVVALILAATLWQRNQRNAAELKQRTTGSYIAYGSRAMDENNLLASLPWFVRALHLDLGNTGKERDHRLRIGTVLAQSPTVVQMWETRQPDADAVFLGDGEILARAGGGGWCVFNVTNGLPAGTPFGPGSDSSALAVNTAHHLAVTVQRTRHVQGVGPARTVDVWDVRSGRRLQQLVHTQEVNTAAIHPDGILVAAASRDGIIALWNRTNAAPFRWLRSDPTNVDHLVFAPDGGRLYAACRTPKVLAWDLATFTPVLAFTNHQSWIYRLALDPTRPVAASASFDRRVRIWSTASGRELASPLDHGDGVQGVAFRGDGRQLVTAGLDFMFRIWDPYTNRPLHQLPSVAKPQSAAFSPGGRIVTTDYYGTIRVWNMDHARLRAAPRTAAVSGNRRRLAVATNGVVQVFDHDGSVVWSRTESDRPDIRLALDQSGEHLLVWDRPETFHGVDCWTLSTSNRRALALPHRRWTNFVLSPDGRTVLAQSNNFVWFHSIDAHLPPFQPLAHALAAAFHPGGTLAAVLRTNAVETNHPSGRSTIQIVDLATGRLVGDPLHLRQRATFVNWDAAGNRLMIGAADTVLDPMPLYICDRSFRQIAPMVWHRDGLRHGAFSPDGRIALTASEDFTAALWSTEDGRPLTPPLNHRHQVTYGAFSADGRWVVTACRDQTVRVWDASSGEPLTPPIPFPGRLGSVDFTPSGDALVARTLDDRSLWCPLPRDERSVEDLDRIARFLVGVSAGEQHGAKANAGSDQVQLWHYLHTNSPADFSLERP